MRACLFLIKNNILTNYKHKTQQIRFRDFNVVIAWI